MQMKKKDGVSLITLVITIVVVIILTTIALTSSSKVPDEANFTKYRQEMKNVQTGIENKKIKNAAKGTKEEDLTEGFLKVYLEEAPLDFKSFGEDYERVSRIFSRSF